MSGKSVDAIKGEFFENWKDQEVSAQEVWDMTIKALLALTDEEIESIEKEIEQLKHGHKDSWVHCRYCRQREALTYLLTHLKEQRELIENS